MTVNHRMNSVTLHSWITIFGDREVVVRTYSAPDRPSSSARLDERIVESLTAR